MHEHHLFEYAVIRVVPQVEREEFMNVGVVLYCAKERFLKALYKIDQDRFKVFCGSTDMQAVENNLNAFERISKGGAEGGPIGSLDLASRFRWLTATRSTVIQTSKVHPGFCSSADEKLTQLFNQMVLLP